MNQFKITAEEFAKVSIARLATHPNASSAYGQGKMSEAELKALFDKQGQLLRQKFNAFLDIIGEVGEGSLSDKILTGISEDHTLRVLFEDIVSESGQFAGYLSVGDMSLAEKLREIAEAFQKVTDDISDTDRALSVHAKDQDNPHNVTAEQVGLGSAAEDIAGLQTELGAAERDIGALEVRVGAAEKSHSLLASDALRKKAPDETQVVQGAVNFGKDVRFGGKVIFEGGTTTSDQTVMTVEDALIVVNSGGAATASIKGLVIRTEKGDYAFFHDPEDDAIKLSLGSYTVETGEDGSKKVYFTPAAGQAQSLMTRDELLDGHLLRWDAARSTVVDSGKTITDITKDYEAYVDRWVASRGENGTVKVADAVEADDAVNLGTMARMTANPLHGEAAGSSVVLDDIAPAPNVVTVSVESKNLVPLVYRQNWNGNNTVTIRGIVFTTNEDGSITMNGTHDGTGDVSFFLVSSTTNPFVLPKGTYIGKTGLDYMGLGCMTVDGKYGGFYPTTTLEEETKFQYLYLSMMRDKINGKTFNGETVYPMLMRGTVIEDYTQPVAAGTAVTMTCGEEEIPTAVGETVVLSDVAVGTALSVDGDAALYAAYNRDINHAFAELQQAIISLGGNV